MANYGYISVNLTPDLVGEMVETLVLAGITAAPKHDFHCTIMYDERKKEIEKPFAALDSKRVFVAHVISLEALGDGLVFHLSSKELHEEHIRLRNAGWQSPYEGYLPHMSLMYDFNAYDILKLNSVMASWAGRCLTFSGEAFGLD